MVKKFIRQSKDLLNRQNSSILSAATIIAASYLASSIFGLIRNRLLVSHFFGGFEADLDVYFAAFVIPDTIFQLLVVGALSAAFIPVYQEHALRSKKKANRMANAALTSLSLVLFAIIVLVIIFARPLASLISHYPPHQLELMANLIRLMSVAQLFFAVSAFLTGVLQARKRFLIPAVAPIFYNLGTIFGILFLSSSLGIYSAAIGVVFGAFLHMLVQLPFTKNLGFSPRFYFRPRHSGVKSIFRLMPPRTAALGLSQIERWVAVNLTSLLAAGSLSIFSFARQLYTLPISLFGVSLGQASFPVLSSSVHVKDNKKHFIEILTQSVLQIFYFALPASVLILILRIPLVRLAFGADNFPWQATLLTGKALAFLAVSIAPQAVNQLLTRTFHALKDTRTPLKVSLFTIIFFSLSAYITSKVLGLGVIGITISLSLSNIINFFILYILIKKRLPSFSITRPIVKMTLVSLFMGISLWLPFRFFDQFVFDTTRTLPLILLTIIVSSMGLAVYLFFSFVFKISQLQQLLQLISRLGNWRHVLTQTDEVISSTLDDDIS